MTGHHENIYRTAIVDSVTCIAIARQRLGKHMPAVNTPQQ
jgi:hypothetical protein